MQAGRVIKFRAWDPDREKMMYPMVLNWWQDEGTPAFKSEFVDCEAPHECTSKYLYEVEMMQYTGLRDKNGKEIYEGDILRQVYRAETGSYDDRMSFEGHHIGSVVITASKGVCMKNPLCYSIETDETNRSNQYKGVAGYRCEVIGNIYENPELLEVSK